MSKDTDLAKITAMEAEIKHLHTQLVIAQTAYELRDEHEQWLTRVIRNLFSQANEKSIGESLQALGNLIGVDCCALGKIQRNEGKIYLSHSWYKHQPPKEDFWKNITLSDIPYLLDSLNSNTPLVAHDINDHHKDLQVLTQKLAPHMRAVALIPLCHRGTAEGFLVLYSQQRPHEWTSHDLQIAETVADVMAMVVSRQSIRSELAQREARFQHVMEASLDGLWDWDIRTGEVYLSPSYLNMLGYKEDEWAPNLKSLYELVFDEDTQLVRTALQEAIDQQKGSLKLEYRLKHKDGAILWVSSRMQFIDASSTHPAKRCVGIHSNVTAYKTQQQQLREAKYQADAANHAKSEFLARMSHEIRTPINAIVGMSHLLRDTSLNRKQYEYINNIDQGAASLLNIINEVLDFSKIDSGNLALESIHFDLDEIIRSVASEMEPDAERKKLEVIYNWDADTPRFLKGDAVRLQQILINLVGNAIKFTDQGEIIIDISQKKSITKYVELAFTVSDTGIGISPSNIEHLFDPFTQGDESCRRRFGGTGIGLALCRQLVDLMGGTISASSQESQGSQFHFTVQLEHSHIGALPLRDRPHQFKDLKTLIVDDNKTALDIISHTARSIEMQPACASSAEAAIEILEASDHDPSARFDLILMDYRLPGIDGISATKIIKQDNNIKDPPPIIIISAHHKDEIFSCSDASFVDGFVSKPVSPSALFDAVSEVFSETITEKNNCDTQLISDDKRLENCHILLAEDNLVNQKVAAGILKKRKVTVTIANNGQEALDILTASKPGDIDLILMDMEMPELDGYSATKKIRQGDICTDIPIIALTAHALKGDKEKCLAAGMDGYITKPVMPNLLFETILEFYNKRSIHADKF